jgi:hypothetical protein
LKSERVDKAKAAAAAFLNSDALCKKEWDEFTVD